VSYSPQSLQKCGYQDCTNETSNSGVFKMRNGHETKSWCSNHKWCSYHRRYELFGPCDKRKKTDARTNKKVCFHHASIYAQLQYPQLKQSNPALVAVGDYFECILALILS
jgi:hypothetical protein